MPESVTTSWTAQPSSGSAACAASGPRRTATPTLPRSGVNLTALDTRLDTTWRILRRSPTTTVSEHASSWIAMPRRPACGANVASSLATRSASDSVARSSASWPDSSDDTSSTAVMRPSSWSALPRIVVRYSR
jgi:hypothetical protein